MAEMALKPLNLPDLPEDVFLLIFSSLDAWDVCRCRRVARAWKVAFEKEEYLSIMLQEYSLTREVRTHNQQRAAASGSSSLGTQFSTREVFDTLASRYYHLSHGKARSIEKYKLFPSEQFGHWFPVAQWEYHESQPGGRLYYENATHISRLGAKPFLFRPTFWTYDDGLVVMALGTSEIQSTVRAGKQSLGNGDSALMLLDLQNRSFYSIPFQTDNKVVRNLRLRDRTLIIEWAEKQAFHALNDSEPVHRHFVTCFDVFTNPYVSAEESPTPWVVKLRNEFKIHFLGLPLTYRDRFFSTHNAKHYAVYFWQPNRSMYTGDEERPLESLFVWDISSPSSYLPSDDPTGNLSTNENHGPQIIERLVLGQLDFYGIRQHSDIALMSLQLDSATHSLTVRENICVAGQGYFDPAERLSCAKTTTLLFKGQGPHLYREWDGNLPPYRGHCSMESTDIEEPEKWFLPVMDVFDEVANVRFSVVQTCFTGQYVENSKVIRVTVNSNVVSMSQPLVDQIAAMGKIAGDERWLVGQNHSQELVVLKF